MRVLPINPADPPDDRLQPGLEALRQGEIVALPTDTFYGLAVDALNGEALARLNRLKNKPEDSAILLLLADAGQAAQVAGELPPLFEPLVAMFWPGPLTLVVPAGAGLPREIAGPGGTVGLRVPGLALPRRIAAALGRPISGVSANQHGAPPARTAAEVAAAVPTGVALIFDGGPTTGGAPSTIVDVTSSPPRLLREGCLPRSSLQRFLPDLR